MNVWSCAASHVFEPWMSSRCTQFNLNCLPRVGSWLVCFLICLCKSLLLLIFCMSFCCWHSLNSEHLLILYDRLCWDLPSEVLSVREDANRADELWNCNFFSFMMFNCTTVFIETFLENNVWESKGEKVVFFLLSTCFFDLTFPLNMNHISNIIEIVEILFSIFSTISGKIN